MGEHQMEDCGPLYAGSKKAAVNWFYGTPWFVATSEEVLKGQQWWVCQQALCTVQTKSQWLHNVSNFAGRRDFLPPGRHCSLNWCVWHIFRTEISCSGVVWFEDDCSFKVVCSLFPISRVYISHLWKQRCFFFCLQEYNPRFTCLAKEKTFLAQTEVIYLRFTTSIFFLLHSP